MQFVHGEKQMLARVLAVSAAELTSRDVTQPVWAAVVAYIMSEPV